VEVAIPFVDLAQLDNGRAARPVLGHDRPPA
jgi:hypothetical protein